MERLRDCRNIVGLEVKLSTSWSIFMPGRRCLVLGAKKNHSLFWMVCVHDTKGNGFGCKSVRSAMNNFNFSYEEDPFTQKTVLTGTRFPSFHGIGNDTFYSIALSKINNLAPLKIKLRDEIIIHDFREEPASEIARVKWRVGRGVQFYKCLLLFETEDHIERRDHHYGHRDLARRNRRYQWGLDRAATAGIRDQSVL